MPFSARTRAAVRNAVITLTATVALIGVAGTASGAISAPTSRAAVTVQASVTPACAACGTGF